MRWGEVSWGLSWGASGLGNGRRGGASLCLCCGPVEWGCF